MDFPTFNRKHTLKNPYVNIGVRNNQKYINDHVNKTSTVNLDVLEYAPVAHRNTRIALGYYWLQTIGYSMYKRLLQNIGIFVFFQYQNSALVSLYP